MIRCIQISPYITAQGKFLCRHRGPGNRITILCNGVRMTGPAVTSELRAVK